MLHPHTLRKRRVCFDDNVMKLAECFYVGAGIKGMDFDLVDSRLDSGFRVHEFFQLQIKYQHTKRK